MSQTAPAAESKHQAALQGLSVCIIPKCNELSCSITLFLNIVHTYSNNSKHLITPTPVPPCCAPAPDHACTNALMRYC